MKWNCSTVKLSAIRRRRVLGVRYFLRTHVSANIIENANACSSEIEYVLLLSARITYHVKWKFKRATTSSVTCEWVMFLLHVVRDDGSLCGIVCVRTGLDLDWLYWEMVVSHSVSTVRPWCMWYDTVGMDRYKWIFNMKNAFVARSHQYFRLHLLNLVTLRRSQWNDPPKLEITKQIVIHLVHI